MTAKNKTKKQSAKGMPQDVTVKDCTFAGVKVDAEAAHIIEPIAAGLLETAKALGALSRLLQGSKINIDSMLKIAPTPDNLDQK